MLLRPCSSLREGVRRSGPPGAASRMYSRPRQNRCSFTRASRTGGGERERGRVHCTDGLHILMMTQKPEDADGNANPKIFVHGGGGFPPTPKFTLKRYTEHGRRLAGRVEEEQADEAESLLDLVGVRRRQGVDEQWLLLTDKRSKLQEVFELETSTVIR